MWFLKLLGYELWLIGSHGMSHIVIGSIDPSGRGHDILNVFWCWLGINAWSIKFHSNVLFATETFPEE